MRTWILGLVIFVGCGSVKDTTVDAPASGSDAPRIDAGVCISGATVHFVTHELDGGPIVAQAAVPVLGHDTIEALAARILAVEHQLYPLAVKMVASGAACMSGNRVVRDAKSTPIKQNCSLFWPTVEI